MKSRKQRNILGGRIKFLLLAFGILLLGCGSKTKDSRTIDFWAMGVEAQHLGELITVFEKENPELHVRVQAIPWSAAHEKLLTAYAGNSTPDLCQLGNTWIPEFVILNAIEPLDTLLKTSTDIDTAQYFSGIWATNEIDGTLYGIPWYIDTRLLFYRKDIFEELGHSTAPTTWEELFDLSLKIQNEEKTEYAFYLPLNGWHEIVAMAMQNGSTLLKDNNSYGDFDAPEFQNALRFFLK
ncbi:MAG: extracellular solute-binding protein, partial [bacterium]